MEADLAALQVSKMTKLQKLAALLIILGPDGAAQILKNLDEPELEAVTSEMSKLTIVTNELRQEILKEFTDIALQASAAVLGGATYARGVLEKSVGLFRASDIIGRVAPAPIPIATMRQILEMDCRQLFNLVKHEQPQTVALLVSFLSPEKSSQLLTLFKPETRDLVVERLATLGPTPVEVVERIVEVLNQKTKVKSTRALNQTGGVKNAADLLNSLEKDISHSLLMDLERRNPELTMAIRQKMFTFEDLTMLDKTSLQKIMREVDTRDLAVALKGASPKTRDVLLGSISKRAAETVNEEISFLGSVKKRDIEASQLRIIDSVRQLESEGEIELTSVKDATRDEALA
jgi:flagellar motor switch protein FliG